jgi:hypothetical protein
MDESPPRPRRSPVVVLLDWLLGLATAVQTGNMPGARPSTVRPGRSRRAGLIWLLAGVLVVAGGTTILVGTLLRAPGGLADLPPAGQAGPAPAATSIGAPANVQQPPPVAESSRASASASPSLSGSASAAVPTVAGSVPGSVPAGSAAVPPVESTTLGSHLTAAYLAKYGSGLLGYRAGVTLTAEGPGASTDWRMTITLPRSTLQIAPISGATVTQNGATWTFTPTGDTRSIAAGAKVEITFDVRGATLVDAQPTDCQINGEACSGL